MSQVSQPNGKTPTTAAKKPASAKKLQKKPSENGAMPAKKKVKSEKVCTSVSSMHAIQVYRRFHRNCSCQQIQEQRVQQIHTVQQALLQIAAVK